MYFLSEGRSPPQSRRLRITCYMFKSNVNGKAGDHVYVISLFIACTAAELTISIDLRQKSPLYTIILSISRLFFVVRVRFRVGSV